MEPIIATIATAAGLFAGTNIDDMVVLAVLNASRSADGRPKVWQISHAVFNYGFVDAMKSTLYLPIVVLLVGAIATLLIQRRVAAAGVAGWQQAGVAGDNGSGKPAQAGGARWPQQGQAGAARSWPQQ